MTADCLRMVFGPADRETNFPSQLKFLSLPDWLHLDDSVVEEIALNCEQLRSLSLARCPLVTLRGFRAIAKSLKELRFLDINELADRISASLFAEVGAKDLPHLVYLSAHCKNSSSDAELLAEVRFSLQRLLLRKPTLMLSDAVNSFLTYKLKNAQATFNDTFAAENVAKIVNELSREEGFCCMSRIT
uniref:F-box domain-containing protein n=1 Tax=Ascaris lumbricoides TaxID=6252 RepID=A0A0M3IMI5_ASCLU